jgi:DNA-binding NtrC family response regulator
MESLPGDGGLPDLIRHSDHVADRGSKGLLLCRDLIFLSKIKGTAEALGYQIVVANDVKVAKAQIESMQPCVVLIDLSAVSVSAPDAIREYSQIAGPHTRLVGFGSHVNADALAAAKAAGCHDVMPRSKFSVELPNLLKHYFQTRNEL